MADSTAIDAKLEDWRLAQPHQPSAVFAAVVGQGAETTIGAVGTRSLRDSTPVSIDDAVHIGSCTKSLTAALWARLVESGAASWDISLSDLFDDLDPQKGWANHTIADLLRCRAGVAPNPPLREMAALMQVDADPSTLVNHRSTWAARVLSARPKRPVRFVYSNLSYIVAGAAVDRVAGEPYEAALARLVLEPLGITDAGFGAPPSVCGHRRTAQLGLFGVGPLRPAPAGDPKSDNPPLFNPAGRLHLPIGQWAQFVRVFLNAGSPLLEPASLAKLTEFVDDSPEAFAMGWARAHPSDGGIGMQGSNTMWSASAVTSADQATAALVVANRSSGALLRNGVQLAQELLDEA